MQPSGNGIQSVYLTEVPTPLADLLIALIGEEGKAVTDRVALAVPQGPTQIEIADLEMWDHYIESKIESDGQLSVTEREALIVARRGQGLFKHARYGD